MKTSNIKFYLMIYVAFVMLVSCGEKQTDGVAEKPSSALSEDSVVTAVNITEAQFKNAKIQLGYLENKMLSESIKASGYIEVPPQSFAEVSTYIGGVVKSVHVQEGDFVRKGQTVIMLEHPDFIKLQQEYIANKNSLLFLEKEYLRQKELFENNAGTGKIFQETESKYNAEKGNVASLESQLAMLSISAADLNDGQIINAIALKAPISGYISHLNVSLGAYVEPNKELFDVTDNSKLIANLKIYERDVVRVRVGQKVYISLPNQDMTAIEGKIYTIGKSVDSETKNISVRAEIKSNQQHNLIPGMFVNGSIVVTDKPLKAIPSEAVIRTGRKQFIFMATDPWCANPNTNGIVQNVSMAKTIMPEDSVSLSYKMVEVKTSSSGNGFVGITPVEELSNLNIMVVKGAYFLMSQLKSGETVGCCGPEEEAKKAN